MLGVLLAGLLLLPRDSQANPELAGASERVVALEDIGAGELLRRTPEGLLPLPRGETGVRIEITGLMARGRVRQDFHNPYAEAIEVVYVFPLPERAAVHRMEMRIGGRRIVAEIQEREEARQTYDRAKRAGRKAALLDQERPNLFTISAANIPPGEAIEVNLEYIEEVAYDDGRFHLAFPLTFTPRFVPLAEAQDPHRGESGAGGVAQAVSIELRSVGVPDAHRILAPFLHTDDPRGMRVTLEVRLQPGVAIERLESPSHRVAISHAGPRWIVVPADGALRADRDFLLQWKPVAGHEPQVALLLEEGGDGDENLYGLLLLVPPALEERDPWGRPRPRGLPTETLFVIDVSGSMAGPSIAQAREALRAALRRLGSDDAFNILEFNNLSSAFRRTFQSAGDREIRAAADCWVAAREAGGGTMILPALQRALAMSAAGSGEIPTRAGPGRGSRDRLRRIVFLTDGAVGNEAAVLEELHAGLGAVRLHVLGIGRAPNRYLMRKMAAYGHGLCGFISDLGEASNRIDEFFLRIDRPVASDLTLTWDGVAVADIHPAVLPDLHAAEPLLVSLRLRPETSPAVVTMRGNIPGGSWDVALPVEGAAPAGAGIALRWARAKVAALMDRLHEGADPADVRRQVVTVGTAFNLVTRYTSLVAVEEAVTAEGPCRTVRMPNTLPSGSQLLGLPRGGTLGPLHRLVGFCALALGLLLLWVWRRVLCAG